MWHVWVFISCCLWIWFCSPPPKIMRHTSFDFDCIFHEDMDAGTENKGYNICRIDKQGQVIKKFWVTALHKAYNLPPNPATHKNLQFLKGVWEISLPIFSSLLLLTVACADALTCVMGKFAICCSTNHSQIVKIIVNNNNNHNNNL